MLCLGGGDVGLSSFPRADWFSFEVGILSSIMLFDYWW